MIRCPYTIILALRGFWGFTGWMSARQRELVCVRPRDGCVGWKERTPVVVVDLVVGV